MIGRYSCHFPQTRAWPKIFMYAILFVVFSKRFLRRVHVVFSKCIDDGARSTPRWTSSRAIIFIFIII